MKIISLLFADDSEVDAFKGFSELMFLQTIGESIHPKSVKHAFADDSGVDDFADDFAVDASADDFGS